MIKSYEDGLQVLIDKVEGVNEKDWDELVLELGLDLHPDSLRKSFNVGKYSGYRVAKYYKDKFEDEYCTDEEIEKLENLKSEVYKEKVKLRDKYREYRKDLSAEARYENLRDTMRGYFKDMTFVDSSVFGDFKPTSKKKKFAVLQLSDWHYGALCDSEWNKYSVKIATDRATRLANSVKQYCNELNITDLIVEINGDMIEGNIVCGNRVSSEETVAEQIPEVSRLLSEMINSFKPFVEHIKVVTTLGNHGRMFPNKKDQASERENFEMIMADYLRLLLDKEIELITSNGMDIVMYNIDDKVIGLAHGHHDKPGSAIENFVKLYKIAPDEIHLAHFHSMSDKNESNIYITVNGSLKGADDYALGACRESTKASQNLIVYGNDRMLIEIVLG